MLVATTRTRKAYPCPSHEVPFTVVATSDTGRVKRWFNDRSFGFITPKDGGEDVCTHWKQLVGTKV